MKKILFFVANIMLCVGFANAAVRDGTAVSRTKNNSERTTQSRVSTTTKRLNSTRGTMVAPRTAIKQSTPARTGATRTQTTGRTVAPTRTPSTTRTVARAATTTSVTDTRTGAAYEQCKNAYFSCMDQFCTLKNDDYRRCSCNDRVYDLTAKREVLQQAGEQLTVFTENLDVVGMTAAQAAAMKTASEGENALTDDKSTSKALLQAIMNSIRGEDSTVSGKFSDLNSINISFDTANAFGMTDAGQAIAAYNGKNLYSAVYPQCRQAVKNDCTDAALQRAITAYLMAVEQDCNTVQTAIENTQAQMKAAVREGSAMLDLARIENRQKHNSSDIATCIREVESAILSEQVCGANYHKCLDNGEYIDISTGKPITGVVDFYKLQEMLVFQDGVESADQKLASNTNNRTFVSNFENRTKKFAGDALDKCVENADIVWQEYLDKALLDIYYAQKSKVEEIKRDCFDYVSSCYMNSENTIASAMSELNNSGTVVLQPDKLALSNQMCTDYVQSCNNMFDNDIIAMYIQERQDTDTLTACRAIVKQCFDSYGGQNYENFYYPYSGLFKTGFAPDWFSLYDITLDSNSQQIKTYKSECAKHLASIDACSAPDVIEAAFGGFDSMYAYYADTEPSSTTNDIKYTIANKDTKLRIYGIADDDNTITRRVTRPTGVATEVYNQIIDILSTQCMNLQGRFVEKHFIPAGYQQNNLCIYNADTETEYEINDKSYTIKDIYAVFQNENMCTKDYDQGIDTASWGICSCWENGARRSINGTSAKCVEMIPSNHDDVIHGDPCPPKAFFDDNNNFTPPTATEESSWCIPEHIKTSRGQICLFRTENDEGYCALDTDNNSNNGFDVVLKNIPEGL